MMIQVLLIDDDVELAELMRDVLAKYSIELHAVHTPNEGFEALESKKFDLVLLDVMLPQLNGLQMCSKIRYSNAPYKDVSIIILTARTELTDMVVGLETGADDYVKKPFEPRELVARINAILRRTNVSGYDATEQLPAATPEGTPIRNGLCVEVSLEGNVLQIETQRAQVLVNGKKLVVTSMEFELVAALAQRPGEILNRDDLLDEVHGTSGIYTRSIDALIYRLRTKIKEAGSTVNFIRTVRGRGYSLVGQINTLSNV